MDSSDPDITFDDEGVCSHCRAYDQMVRTTVASAQAGQRIGELRELFDRVKAEGKSHDYDCIMGLSGGVDSFLRRISREAARSASARGSLR